MRPLEELIHPTDPAWPEVQEWIENATNKVEILPADAACAAETLVSTQMTIASTMGAIIYNTGGILIDGGWIRLLGSGHERMKRTLPSWNLAKSFMEYGQSPTWWLMADDVLGGLFAVNGGHFGQDSLGKVFYFAPDTLEWECLEMEYTAFVMFCFSGDLGGFYAPYRWDGWEVEVAGVGGDEMISFYPPLWTVEGKDLGKSSRRVVGVEEWYTQLNG